MTDVQALAREALPCPWCDRPIEGGASWDAGEDGFYFVECFCGARGRSQPVEEMAVADWNRIVSSVNAHASLVERVKELEEALREALDLFEMQECEGRETFSPDGILPKLRALAAPVKESR